MGPNSRLHSLHTYHSTFVLHNTILIVFVFDVLGPNRQSFVHTLLSTKCKVPTKMTGQSTLLWVVKMPKVVPLAPGRTTM